MRELKNCPFCGGIAEFKHPDYEYYSPSWCKCTQCRAEGPTKASELEAKEAWNKRVYEWISVKDRLPAETHSIFYRFFGTEIWRNSMWREQSSKVLVTVVFKDATKTVTTGETHDGIWNTTISKTLDPIVTHWMPMPEPPEEDKDDEL